MYDFNDGVSSVRDMQVSASLTRVTRTTLIIDAALITIGHCARDIRCAAAAPGVGGRPVGLSSSGVGRCAAAAADDDDDAAAYAASAAASDASVPGAWVMVGLAAEA